MLAGKVQFQYSVTLRKITTYILGKGVWYMLRMRRRRAWQVISKIALVLAAIVLLIVLLDHWIRPTLTDRLSYQVKGIVTLLVNETVTEELEKLGQYRTEKVCRKCR